MREDISYKLCAADVVSSGNYAGSAYYYYYYSHKNIFLNLYPSESNKGDDELHDFFTSLIKNLLIYLNYSC